MELKNIPSQLSVNLHCPSCGGMPHIKSHQFSDTIYTECEKCGMRSKDIHWTHETFEQAIIEAFSCWERNADRN